VSTVVTFEGSGTSRLTIWGGERGSKSYFSGTFSEDGNTNSGEWVYEDGGGWATTITQVS
jgi:hypothetical protein